MQLLNKPEVVLAVTVEFERYEAALRVHDVAALNDFFLDSEVTLRFGVAEHAYGIAALRAYRQRAAPLAPGRQLQHTVITTWGDAAASVCTEFTAPDSRLLGRQSQCWVRTDAGWKIVAAHVSQIDPELLRRD